MASKEFRTHCKVCGDPITDSTQRVTCLKHRTPQNKRELATCPCGKPAANLRSKYCSEGHRKQWGKKPQVRMVKYTCLGCGNPFERPWFYAAKNKYCSNACSHRQVKKVRDKFIADLPGGAVVFHSMWEVRFVAACERFDVPWRSYDGFDIQTSHGLYRPDFIVNANTVIDVKGYLRPESAAKIADARTRGFDVEVIDRHALVRFEEAGVLNPVEMVSSS